MPVVPLLSARCARWLRARQALRALATTLVVIACQSYRQRPVPASPVPIDSAMEVSVRLVRAGALRLEGRRPDFEWIASDATEFRGILMPSDGDSVRVLLREVTGGPGQWETVRLGTVGVVARDDIDRFGRGELAPGRSVAAAGGWLAFWLVGGLAFLLLLGRLSGG